MARQKNDGRGRLGGRQKGTRNKPQEPIGVWVCSMINKNRRRFENDMKTLSPQERAAVYANLISMFAQVSGKEDLTE